jgi:NADPH-dependent curcumin reductase CurA
MPGLNRQIVLKSRPEGMPGVDNFALTKAAIPEPGDGEVLMRILYLSLDPYMRGPMSALKSYAKRRHRHAGDDRPRRAPRNRPPEAR